MSKTFSFDKPNLTCDADRCLSRVELDTGVPYPEKPAGLEMWWSSEQRATLKEGQDRAWAALYAAPMPEGWMEMVGGGRYKTRESGYEAHDPVVCSLRCARLWIGARERAGVTA